MSSLFGSDKMKTPKMQETTDIQQVVKDEEESKKRERRRIPKGRSENILYGIQSVLKKRLGE
ncbi:MAG TPA: hypothetical protein PLP49_10300 [Anaerohalosphaeraceae bacterium]|nr:hypothetical protein [Anaerohalosphaeraceae bacterium]HPB93857.1 hypothetical protein [Anaerohalosphaeraceae bacterium]HRT24353.1 hypothetical protein [Anaerohalosphaeraceae bacterium]